MVASAHVQDFQRRKQPGQLRESSMVNRDSNSPDVTTDEEYEEESAENSQSGENSYKDEDFVEELPFVNSEARRSVEEPSPRS